jgi:hypothetical protein
MKAKQTQLFYMKTQHTFYTAVKIGKDVQKIMFCFILYFKLL